MANIFRENLPDLSRLPLFNGVPADLLDQITIDMIHYHRHGDVIFRRGDDPDGIIIILHGNVCISVNGTHLIARQPLQVVGEQAFIDKTVRSADVIAQGSVKVLKLPASHLRSFMDDAAFNRNLLRIVSEKLREATEERAYRFQQEELLFSEFQAHLAPEVVDRLLATGHNYGEPRFVDAVILMSDIRDFTQRSSGMSPAEISEQLDAYLCSVVNVIHRHEGLVDKFIGDAVLAIWGFVPTQADIAIQAFECAQEMVRTAAQMEFGRKPITIGVGLNAGEVFIGNIGSKEKRQFTVLGTPVNLAARYESKTKELERPIVVGQSFYDRLPIELQQRCSQHSGLSIKGSQEQSVYSFSPKA